MSQPSTTTDRPRGRRRFTLLDALALIAATALGLAPMRGEIAFRGAQPLARIPNARALAFLTMSIEAVGPLLASWTLAALALRLRSPRPSLRRLTRQPGFAANAAVILCLLTELVLVVVSMLAHPAQRLPFVTTMARTLGVSSHMAASGVAGAWLVLALGGLWRPEPSWIDRLGRFLGGSWLGLFLVGWLRTFLV